VGVDGVSDREVLLAQLRAVEDILSGAIEHDLPRIDDDRDRSLPAAQPANPGYSQ
jgi:hypothetical protein